MHRKAIERKDWTELEQYDLFMSIIKRSDDIANHTIGIYNKYIVDPNKKSLIPLCQEELNYFVSTKSSRNDLFHSLGDFSLGKIVWRED